MAPHRIAFVGLGPIGRSALSFALQRSALQVVAACDPDPGLKRPLAELVNGAPEDVSVHSDLDAMCQATAPGIAVLCTGSRVPTVAPQLETLVRHGWQVISTCEELVFPWHQHASWSEQFAAQARHAGVTVLGCGINPGFLMEFLPAVVCGACLEVHAIQVERVVDAGTRRGSLQQKVGAGLEADAFRQLVREEKLGHVGLVESTALLCHALGWDPPTITESIEPVMAAADQVTPFVEVKRQQVAGIDHRVTAATTQGQVELKLQMYVGAEQSHDSIRITGEPSLELLVPAGVPGDLGTVGVLLNLIPAVAAAAPGLQTIMSVRSGRTEPPSA